ncbi:Chitinase [Purpureocillium takamizusanense]|uniref:chitinase n=1 Tax=Purpureocillium takamizusanense TaxID=2060973 RepID=A0A9Q8Q7D3_9HYPO|nr:Chitinase [Purpureocillium takamizusanense]UNI13831.1 Chitinase [Purpureocillium takamizusanense]
MSLSLGGAFAAGVGSYGALNGYWGQHNNQNLKAYCDTGIQYATIGFVNLAPEHDPSDADYPGINFSSHCWADAYADDNGKPSKLLSHCEPLRQDITYCQSKGVKVILSIGGVYSADKNNYDVSTTANGEYFADFLYKAFGPYNPANDVPRPFDYAGEHVAVDGFDFDLENPNNTNMKPYIAMANKFRALDKSLILTAAPQCPLSAGMQHMKELLQSAALDALFIQFYNNPVCDYIPGNDGFGEKFNLDDWVTFMASTQNSKNAKLFVGLPAGPTRDSANTGYITPDKVKELVCKYSTKTKNWGGISLWDLDTGAANVVNGKTFNQHVLDALKYGCSPVPTTTSTTVSSTKTSSTKTSSSTTTSSTTTTASSTTTTSSSTTKTSSTTVSSTTTASSSTTASSTSKTSSTTPSSTVSSTSSSSTTQASSTSASSTSEASSTTPSSTASSTTKASSSTTESSTSQASSSSTVSTTQESSSSSTSATDVSSTAKPTVTSTTTDVSVTPPVTTSSTTPVTSIASSTSKWSNSTITSHSASMTTSTVYTTTVHTVTKCPPYVTDCPLGHVTTETIPIYTTVCPVTETQGPKPPKPTHTKPSSSSAAWTTSTVYTTKVHTVTACPPQVTNCPVGHVTTETVPLYTTVCPVTETETGKVPQPTPSVPGGNPVNPVNPPKATTTTGATSTLTKTVTVPGGTKTLQTLTRPTAVKPAPSCAGTGCPGVSSGVAVPTQSWTATPVVPGSSAVPSSPVQAGASTLALGLSGLVAMVAFQVFAL